MRIYIGIDNGVTGGIAIQSDSMPIHCFKTPIKRVLDYTKKAQFVSRVDVAEMKEVLTSFPGFDAPSAIAYIERPMVNPARFVATKSALRCLEATLICLEDLGIKYKFVDSKEWQSRMLPKGLNKQDLKKASLEVVRQRFGIDTSDNGVSDAVLICEFAKLRENLKI